MSEEIQNYRRLLQDLETKAQEQYDKTVLTLSGGALGVSFTFLKDIITLDSAIHIWLLIIAWTLSCSAVLWSFYSSRKAMRQAIKDLDNSVETKNKSDFWTSILNFSAGLLFAVGLASMIAFAYFNLGEKQMNKILAEGNNVPEKLAVQAPASQTGDRGQNVPEKPKDKHEGNEQKKN